MGLFDKPSLAQIYVKELRTRLDTTLVPLFAPDVELKVGAIGSFDEGQFVASGSSLIDEFGIELETHTDRKPSDWAFSSEGSVNLVPEGTVSVGGADLLKGKLEFTRDRAVVASFLGVTASTAVWTGEVNRKVWELYLSQQLKPNEVVVRTVRRAKTGTVVVTRKSGITVELAADPKLLGGLLSIQGLGAGVTFTGGTQAAVQLSGPGMTPFVQVKGSAGPGGGPPVDVKSFEDDPEGTLGELEDVDVPDLESETVLGAANWDEPEE